MIEELRPGAGQQFAGQLRSGKAACGWPANTCALPLEEKVDGVIPFLQPRRPCAPIPSTPPRRRGFARSSRPAATGSRSIRDIFLYGSFFFQDPVYDPDAVEKRLKKEAAPNSCGRQPTFYRRCRSFDHAALEARIKDFCTQRANQAGGHQPRTTRGRHRRNDRPRRLRDTGDFGEEE